MKRILPSLAMLLAAGGLQFAAHAEYTVAVGEEYRPFSWKKDIRPGSVLDFSARLDAPAGKYGPVIIRDGKFIFRDAPEKPVRFYGTNFSRTNQFLTTEWNRKLVERMAAAGFNAVRIHHHDDNLVLKANGKSTALDPKMAAQLDELIHLLKQRGIYITTDLYVSRILVKGELPELPDEAAWQQTFKPLVFVLDSAMANWKEFAANYLNHVNPHTGLALKDDPALISLSLINEDNLSSSWKASPSVTRLYKEKFEAWKAKNNLTSGAMDNADPVFSAFLVETYNRGFDEMKRFVRELGYQGPVSDQNMLAQPLLALMRDRYDFVENHLYWDHPNWPEKPWQLPSSLANISAVVHEGRAPSRIFASRIFGKPMMLTEFDFAAPNRYRAEGAVLTGAYAALQDWDGLFQFTYSHNRENVMEDAFHPRGGFFNLATDAVKSLSQLIGVRLFLDRELRAAPVAAAAALAGGDGLNFAGQYSSDVNRLGLLIRTGIVVLPDGKTPPAGIKAYLDLGKNFPDGLAPAFPAHTGNYSLLKVMEERGVLPKNSYRDGVYRAVTGQIVLDCRKGTFRAVTPSCEAMILRQGAELTGAVLSVKNLLGRGIFSAIAHDGKPLKQSGRILILHLTDSQPENTVFADEKMTRLNAWGGPGYLAARGEGTVTLKGLRSSAFKLYAIDSSGERLREIPLESDAGGNLKFTARVFSGNDAVFGYELVRSPGK